MSSESRQIDGYSFASMHACYMEAFRRKRRALSSALGIARAPEHTPGRKKRKQPLGAPSSDEEDEAKQKPKKKKRKKKAT
jgi:hypothetical protein